MVRQAASPPLSPLRFGVSSVAGRRPVNEDAWSATPAGDDMRAGEFYVVADGLGGQERGDLAAQTAVYVASRSFYEGRAAGGELPGVLRAAIEEANREVYRLAKQLGVERMGCTLVAGALVSDSLQVAHIGDARAYLLQGTRLYPLTKDHTWVQEQVDRGTISAEDAARHELRHLVQRVLGNEAAVEVTLSPTIPFGSQDILILCTDGLHGVVSEKRIAQLVASFPPADAAAALAAEAIARGTEDNVTALVVGGSAISSGAVAGVVAPVTPPRRAAVWPVLSLAALVVSAIVLLGIVLARASGPPPLPTGASPAATILSPAIELESGYPAVATSTAASTAALYNMPGADSLADGAAMTATPAPFPIACIKPGRSVYLWTNEEAADGNVCNSSQIELSDDQVYLLTPLEQARDLYAQGLITIFCQPAPFVQVRSLTTPTTEGWILREHIDATCLEEQ